MKKIMIAALGLSMLSGTAVFAAQNSSAGSNGQMDNGNMSGKKHKKHKKSKKNDSGTTDSGAAAPKA